MNLLVTLTCRSTLMDPMERGTRIGTGMKWPYWWAEVLGSLHLLPS